MPVGIKDLSADDLRSIFILIGGAHAPAARAVSKLWLNTMNSLTPYLMKKVAAQQFRIAMMQQTIAVHHDRYVHSEAEVENMEWACCVTRDRLVKKVSTSVMQSILKFFYSTPQMDYADQFSKLELADAVAEQLHYETDDDDSDDEPA